VDGMSRLVAVAEAMLIAVCMFNVGALMRCPKF
jgi:hypothetical protein